MYRNTSTRRRIIYKYGLFTIITVAVVLLGLTAFGLYKLVHNLNAKSRISDKKSQYLELITEYYSLVATQSDEWVTVFKESYQPEKDILWADFAWTTDTEEFGSIINIMDTFVQSTNTPKSIYYKSTRLWDIVREALGIIQKKLKFPPTANRVPFGTNWYQFSISLPRLITAATCLYETQFGRPDDFLEGFMQRYVLSYLPTPVKSMGWVREGPNIVMMSVPYFGAHILLGDFEDTLDITEVKEVLKTANFQLVTSGEGLYPDGGFWFHGKLRAYGYITSAFNDYVLVNKLFDYTSFNQFYKAFEKIEHPTIRRHFGPWFGRALGMTSNNKTGKLGFYRIDSIAGVSCKTARWLLSFNGQHPTLCAYESDQANYLLCQFWIFARMMMYHDAEASLQPALVTRYPGVVSFDNKLVEMRSTTTTTDQFFASDAHTHICQLDGLLGFYTEFSFPELNIKTWELILVDESTDGYYCLQWLKSVRNVSNSQIYKSVNLGSAGVRYNESPGVVYKFPNDYTHILRGQPELDSNVLGDNGITPYTSLQLTPDNDDYVCFVTCGKPNHNMRSHDVDLRKIELFDASLEFNADLNWLILRRGKDAVIGVSMDPIPKTITVQQADINKVLGLTVRPIDGILTSKSFKFTVGNASLMCRFRVG